MRYSLRTLLEVVAAAAFILALVMAWRSRPAPQPASPPAGRYQVFMSGEEILVMDTTTGWLWKKSKHHTQFHRTDSPWRDRQ